MSFGNPIPDFVQVYAFPTYFGWSLTYNCETANPTNAPLIIVGLGFVIFFVFGAFKFGQWTIKNAKSSNNMNAGFTNNASYYGGAPTHNDYFASTA